jgi:hypothetical protein
LELQNFTPVLVSTATQSTVGGSMAWADADNDGDQDVAICNSKTVIMLSNEGNDQFIKRWETNIGMSGCEVA